MGAIQEWFRERVPVEGDQIRELTNEPVPNHIKRWWFCLGGTPAYLFVVQIVTGSCSPNISFISFNSSSSNRLQSTTEMVYAPQTFGPSGVIASGPW